MSVLSKLKDALKPREGSTVLAYLSAIALEIVAKAGLGIFLVALIVLVVLFVLAVQHVVAHMTAAAVGVAVIARAEGLQRVSESNLSWLERALAMLPRMKQEHPLATGEGMRVWLLANGLEHPTRPNAWGALTMAAIKRGIIVDSGETGRMWSEKSHARRTPRWRFV